MSFFNAMRHKAGDVKSSASHKLKQWSDNAEQKLIEWEDEQIAQWEGVEQSMRKGMPASRLLISILRIIGIPMTLLAVIFLFFDNVRFFGILILVFLAPFALLLIPYNRFLKRTITLYRDHLIVKRHHLFAPGTVTEQLDYSNITKIIHKESGAWWGDSYLKIKQKKTVQQYASEASRISPSPAIAGETISLSSKNLTPARHRA